MQAAQVCRPTWGLLNSNFQGSWIRILLIDTFRYLANNPSLSLMVCLIGIYRLTLLLIDDTPTLLFLLSQELACEGFEVRIESGSG